ncbi:hypothetical protein AB0I02_02280 [Streptomyces phaeochromogenes]
MSVETDDGVDETVVPHDTEVQPQHGMERAGCRTAVVVEDDEPGELGQPGTQQLPTTGGKDGTQVVGVPGEHQLHVFQPHPRLAAEQLVHGVRAEDEPLRLPVAEGDVQPRKELTTARHLGHHVRLTAEKGRTPGVGEPDQHVHEPADRQQPVLVTYAVPVVCGPVAEPSNVVERIQNRAAANVRTAALDQVVQGLRRRVALDAVVTPQLLEQLLGQFPDQGHRVLGIAVIEGP